MLTNLFRVIETRNFKPLKFTTENLEYVDNEVEDIGIYVHIPFCKKLCAFCPYNKVKYNEGLALKYKDALLKEIQIVGEQYKNKRITSVYFGGGTPALMINELKDIIEKLKKLFTLDCNIGIELHPRDVTRELASKLKDIGFNMVSLGIQSFQKENLKNLDREYVNGEEALRICKECGFDVIDVDFIFGIKDQRKEDLREDFLIAFREGATQVSTYPFIDFSYANNKSQPLGKKEKKELLNELDRVSRELNLERTSVWTFGKKDTDKYSSITRDTYVGFGPSAASLTNKYFKVNTFSVEEYIKSVNGGKNPKALTMNFTPRVRALYWGFWNAYTLELDRNEFRKLFNKDIESYFALELSMCRIIGLIKKSEKGYKLTKRGSYLYHLLEQHYTHEYIDKTWRICGENPWPDEIKLY